MLTWEVPGYRLGRLLGFGPLGEVWLATSNGTGETVVLRRLAGFDPAEVAAVLAPLPALPPQHLVRLRDVHQVDGDAVLVLDHAPGGSLRQRELTPGQVVTALAPVAALLGEAHAHGLEHGRLTAGEVLVSAAGRPLLDGLGISGLRDRVADDLDALRSIGLDLLGDQDDAVRDVLSDACDLADLADGLLSCCPAQPLVPAPPALPVPGARERRPRWRLGVVRVVVPVAVATVGATVVLYQRPERLDWRQLVLDLDARRAAAFAQGDPSRLHEVYADGSSAAVTDTAALKDLADRRQTVLGLNHRLLSVQVEAAADDRVELDVLAALTPYRVVGPGPVTRQVPGGAAVRQRIVLVRTADGWRLQDVTV